MSRIHPRYCFIVDPQAGYKHTVCIRGALSVSKCESDKQKAANVVISLVYLTQVCVCGLAKKLYFYVSHKESTVREKIAGCIEEGFMYTESKANSRRFCLGDKIVCRTGNFWSEYAILCIFVYNSLLLLGVEGGCFMQIYFSSLMTDLIILYIIVFTK